MITSRKKILCFLVIAICLACVFTVSALANGNARAITEIEENDGLSFTGTEGLHVSKTITEMPRTYEAVVYLGEDAEAREGTIFGNYVNLENPQINFSLDSAGKPKIYVHDTYVKGERQTTFSMGSSVKGMGWTHIVITHEKVSSGDVFKCYINGVLADTKTSSYTYDISAESMEKMQYVSSFYVGQDYRPETDNYRFKGKIKDVAIYSEALSAEEVAASYNNGVNTANDSLILYYELTAESANGKTVDKSGNGHTLKPIYHARENELDMSKYGYSFAVIGDTQKLVENDAANGASYAADIYDWIVSNADAKKIERVIGLGDITESNIASEWEYAVLQHDKLENAGIPYSITWGYSHDGLHGEEFTTYFGNKDNFKNSSIVYHSGADSATALANYYQTFRAGSTDYMILSLGWSQRLASGVLEWADAAVKAHKDHKVILVTHYYLGLDSGVDDEAMNIWENVVSNNENVIMTLSGHIQYGSNIVRSTVIGNQGQTINQFLINPQYTDTKYGYDKSSFVAMFYFSEDGKTVDVEYISTSQSKKAGSDVLYGSMNEFTFTNPEPLEVIGTAYGTIPNDYISAEDYPFAIFDGNKNFVGAAPYLLGEKKADSAIGIAKNFLKSNKWDKNNQRFVGPDGNEPLEVYILVRRNVAMDSGEYYNDFSQIQGTVVMDLNGNTLTTPSGKALFNTILKEWTASGDENIFPSEITVKNGFINNASREIIQLEVNATGNDKKFIYNFENVGFKVMGSSLNFALRHKDSSAGTLNTPVDINFIDCDIDVTAATASSIILFNLSDYTTAANITVKGGTISTGTVSYRLYTDKKDAGNLRFETNALGEYTTIVSSSDAAAVTSDKFNDGALYFKKVSEADGYVTYGPVITITYNGVGYDIPYEYLSKEEYPFLIFGSNGTFVNAAKYFYGAKADDSAINLAKNYLKANKWENGSYGDNPLTAVVYLRRDVQMASDELYNNISQVQGTITIDLNGFTLSAPVSSYLFPTEMKQWTGSGDATIFPSEIVVKNGNIVIYNKSMIQFGANANGSGKAFTYKFDNVDFFAKGSTTDFAISHKSTTSTVLYPNVIFNDCDVDISGSTASSKVNIFSLGTTSTNTSVVFNGGSIIVGGKAYALTSKASGTGSFAFGADDSGKHTTFVTSKGAAFAEDGIVYTTIDGVECVFVKVSENNGYVNYSLYPEVMVDYKIKTSITLWSNFVYNIYIPKTNVNSFKINGLAADYEEVEIDGVVYYHVAVNLPAGETLSDINLCVTLNSGSTTVDANWTLNVYNYTKSVLAGEFDDTTKTLMKDMLVYASAAHTYFDNTTAVAETLAEINTLLGDYTAALPTGEAKQPTTDTYFTKVEVYVGEVPSFRFYLAEAYTADDFTFKVGKRNANVTVGDGYVEIVMYAYMMLDDVTFTVKGTDVSESYNLYSYYAYAKTLGNANLTAVVEALMKYSVSAKAYRDAVIGA